MSEDLNKLKALLQEDVPPPSKGAKLAALQAGMAAFEKNAETFQGSPEAARPTNDRPHNGAGFLEGLRIMFKQLSPRGLMLGGASFATITLAIVVTQSVNLTGPAPFDMDANVPTQGSLGDSELGIAPRPAPEAVQVEMQEATAPPAMPETESGEPGLIGKIAAGSPVNSPRAEGAEDMRSEAAQAPAVEAPRERDIAPPAPSMSVVIPNPAPVIGGSAETLTQGFTAGQQAPSDSILAAQPESRDQFAGEAVSPIKVAKNEPVSTFSIDIDTASYSVMRRSLLNGHLPNPDSVRTEELINYFDYNYASPQTAEQPFAPQATLMPTPWNADTLLLHIGIQGYEIPLDDRPPVNLVFLIDTSGSMNAPDKLPLLIQSFRLLLTSLNAQDTVAIVTYAGSAGMALEPTPASESYKILTALSRLSAGGSTAGQAGLEQAYGLAESMMEDGETSRVILATDGDFNVGMHSPDAMQKYIEDKRETGVYLSILGFGQGNYNDALMQTLAQNGNGTAAYIDTLAEAQKLLVDQIGGALFTIAQDVKIQVEFNPAEVAEYRLIGYETRALNREDFNNDAVDAGDIGAGTQVTALYEITPVGSAAVSVDPLRYGEARPLPEGNGELAFLKLRYKLPGESTSNLITTPVLNAPIDQVTQDVIFSTAVASFGQLLRGDTRMGGWGFDDVLRLAQQGKGEDRFGYRSEFIRLVRLAETAQ